MIWRDSLSSTALPQKFDSHLDRVSTGSGSDLVEPWESKIVGKYRMLITDQVATAPCTDPIQECFPTFEGKAIFHLQGGTVQGKQIVSQRLLEEMYAPQCTAKEQICGYGLGIYKAIQHNTARLSHGGLGYGISTHYRFLSQHKIGVVPLTNQDAAHNAPDLATRVIELMLAAKLGVVPKNEPVTVTDKPVVSVDERTLRRLAGTYLLYEGILFRFKYEKGNLFHIVGNEKLKLDAHSSNEFTHGSRLYRFFGEDGRRKGVQIFDPHYGPQTGENSVLNLAVNDAPIDGKGLNKPEWSQHVGRYAGTFIGATSVIRVSLENGHLYLNGELRLTEIKPGFFITADGESVIFSDQRLLIGNKFILRINSRYRLITAAKAHAIASYSPRLIHTPETDAHQPENQ